MRASFSAGWVLAVWLSSLFMTQLDVTIVNVAAPSMHADLGASGAELELVVGAYLLGFAVLLITGARLGALLGHRRVFLLGLVAFTAASLLCGLAPDPVFLIAARVVQGMGAALAVPQVLTGIQVSVSEAERPRALGLYALALSSGAVCGQILGGVLVSADLLGAAWRPIFLINLPVGAAAIAAGLRFLPPDPEQEEFPRIDMLGVAALAATVLPALLALSLGRSEGWPTWSWACLAASAPGFAAFVLAERRIEVRGGAPLINLHALARRAVSLGLAAQAASVGTYYALLFTLALYVQRGLGRGALASGLTLVSFVAGFGVASRLVGRLRVRLGRRLAPGGSLLLALAYASISASLFAGERDDALLILFLGAGGLGLGLQYSAMTAHLTSAVPSRYAADISGAFTTIMQIAGAIGVAGFGTAYLSLASHPGVGEATDAFAVVTGALGLVALLATVMAAGSTGLRRDSS